MAFKSSTSLQMLGLVTQELDHEQARIQNHSTQSSTSILSSTSEKGVKNGGRKKGRWNARDDRFELLLKKARKCAEERHAALEKMKMEKTGRKPSRAVTSKQKSSKKSAEMCRIKMRAYTEFLEAELAGVQADIDQQRLARAEMAQHLYSLSARFTLHLQRKQNQHQAMAAKNNLTSVSPSSFMSEVTTESDYFGADHISAVDEQVFLQDFYSSFTHTSPRVEEADPALPLSDDDANFSSSGSASDILHLPLSPLSTGAASQPEDDMTSDAQEQEIGTYALQKDDAQATGSFIDFEEMDACLEFQSLLPTATLFNSSSSPEFSFLL